MPRETVKINHKDHIVPQLLIRQFCNEEGRVFCFDKKKRRIPNRELGNTPNEILRFRGYYRDPEGNLDVELYQSIEQAFGPHLARLVIDPWQASQEEGFGRALIEWIAAQVSRTELIPLSIQAAIERVGEVSEWNESDIALEVRRSRINSFKSLVQLMALPKWEWKLWKSDDERRFVLSDHPVVNTTTDTAMGYMLFVPLSPTQMLIGGSNDGHQVVKEREILRGINGLIFSWSQRYTYSASLPELESIAHMFEPTGDEEHEEWMRYAREPHHGIAKRIREESIPKDIDPDFLKKAFS